MHFGPSTHITMKQLVQKKEDYIGFSVCMLSLTNWQIFIYFFYLIIYVPSTIFQLCRDWSSWVEPVLSLN